MSASNTTENAILNLIFSATTWANYAINATSSPETNIVVALHTDDPGETGAMNTNEADYDSYARVNVARSTGWTTATTGSVSPAANIDFPESTGDGTSMDFWSTGKSGGGAQPIIVSGAVSPAIAVGAAGITPRLGTSTTISLD